MNIKDLKSFGISQDQLLDLVVHKIIEDNWTNHDLSDALDLEISRRLDAMIAKSLNERIDETLKTAMDELLQKKIFPVDVWGDKTGEPTTLKEALTQKAQTFWQEKLNSEGKLVSYGGKERFKFYIDKAVQNEFRKVVSENITDIVLAFKTVMKKDSAKWVQAQIDTTFKTIK